ncbi:bifunctional diaminohydroxyphosphoribosylaminopyrimidine deaminase/5-amino-6-(5-phosphoribosylamino)uracil reductase RibD [Candidatus Venteria ishoeyi]|uniref:Riboflavin biosynthesis protein RibD n=1 Tax=Candidatus Venteria ishoeyi TaxID=1899563 RepID=A0A1H6FGH2_9GAMM|nr:bifunctional diaminohydroxyphosphoribosylaminopyrimidine deaminase/5-amino-6-(5-phosphoribosylamino)uracil reductase RibD [Candidatus Venteria ishoeyi]MDM8547398.1 bifunctional diaminohydroxyphosphoribosylaminopyrimidine deaminase/5-amino-6-(5-phosphoribosylamino)uracil reductase RibD [Candidatus Venteria ishoeyi]SEH08753.1 Riboflavin biosynthesis protein RibD [Candidatus Venteria ishoeyi]
MNDEYYMAQALRLAEQGLWTTDPNPRVGCVLVKDEQIVGQGWHQRAGEGHAEVNALNDAGDAARGATAYVTLEPCCIHGRTPPCTDALIKAGVARVVTAMQDPNPQVIGNGIKQLQAAGIEVKTGVLQADAEKLNPGFISRMCKGRPYVRCKLAMSLDGRTAMKSGESYWITGEAARRDAQSLRARSSAIMTGVGTVLTDNPSMNVRPGELPEHFSIPENLRQPLRIVVDHHLSLPADAKLLGLPGQTLVVTASDDPESQADLKAAGAEVLYLPAKEGGIDLAALCQLLGDQEINELHLECGANLAGAMLRAKLIDELVLYVAPVLMGDSARGLFHLPGLELMAERIPLKIADMRAVGQDWRVTVTFPEE